MSIPTSDEIAKVLGVQPDVASTIHGLMDGSVNPLSFVRAERFHAQCYTDPPWRLTALYAIDELLDTCGIEGFADHDNCRYGVSYCNTGETYAPTVLLVTDERGTRFELSSYCDFIEAQYDEDDTSDEWSDEDQWSDDSANADDGDGWVA